MPDIRYRFPIHAAAGLVFRCVSTAEGLDQWWTKTAASVTEPGGAYVLDFGPGYRWSAVATKYDPGREFELEMTEADADWTGTKLGFLLEETNGVTQVEFYHCGWPEANEHFRISGYCWAMYLRILKRYLESGERVPYESRLEV